MDKSEFRQQLLAAMPKLKSYCVKLTRNVDRANDLAQDTIVKALAYAHSYVPHHSNTLAPWLYTIALNAHRTQHRRAFRNVEDPDGYFAKALAEPPQQDNIVTAREVLAHIERLKPLHRSTVIAALQCDDYQDIANTLHVPIGTVKSRVFRAREALSKSLGLPHAA